MKTNTTIRRVDMFILIIAIVMTFIILKELDIAEKLHNFSRTHEAFDLDEIVLTTALAFLYLAIFTLRRYVELLTTHQSSITDSLVDALNRRGGLALIRKTMARANRADDHHCLILFDIDNFKRVNDTFGHEVGDRLLKSVTKISASQLRTSDALIRWGGEEFLILCKNTTLPEAANLAERIRMMLESSDLAPIANVTASFGVAELDLNQELHESIKVADQRQYLSKDQGKNRVTWQDPVQLEKHERCD